MKKLTQQEFDFIMENANWIQLYQYFKEEYDVVKDTITEMVFEINVNELLNNFEKDC